MSSTPVNPLTQLVLSSQPSQTKSTSTNFYAALADAWANALDKQAQVITDKSAALNQDGNDTPGELTKLTAESSRFTFMANSASTSIKDAAEALKTVASK